MRTSNFINESSPQKGDCYSGTGTNKEKAFLSEISGINHYVDDFLQTSLDKVTPILHDYYNEDFADWSAWRRYKLYHTGIKQHCCDVCNRVFVSNHCMLKPKFLHYGIKKYKCSMCDQTCVLVSHFIRHKLAHCTLRNTVNF